MRAIASATPQGEAAPAQVVVPGAVAAAPASSDPNFSSPTDAVVNRIAEMEKRMKEEARTEWLKLNRGAAAGGLAGVGIEFVGQLAGGEPEAGSANPAASFLQEALGDGKDSEPKAASGGPSENLLRRMTEVALRRVARKRGVSVEAPELRIEDDTVHISITYTDDGRVLDGPEDLAHAFTHAISTEIALKGLDVSPDVSLFRNRDGETDLVHGEGGGGRRGPPRAPRRKPAPGGARGPSRPAAGGPSRHPPSAPTRGPPRGASGGGRRRPPGGGGSPRGPPPTGGGSAPRGPPRSGGGGAPRGPPRD